LEKKHKEMLMQEENADDYTKRDRPRSINGSKTSILLKQNTITNY
jgi:hypothetical protein